MLFKLNLLLYQLLLFDEFLVYFFQIGDPPDTMASRSIVLSTFVKFFADLSYLYAYFLVRFVMMTFLKKSYSPQCTMFIILSKDAVGLSMSQSFSCSVKTYITLMCWLDESSMSAIREGDVVRDVVRDVVHDVVVAVDGDVCLVYQLVYGSNFVVV
jgi:hypothetical protein